MQTDFGVAAASLRTESNPHSQRKWKVLQNLFTLITVIRRFRNKYCSKSFQSYLADAFQTRDVFHSPGNSELWNVDLPGRDLDEISRGFQFTRAMDRDLKAYSGPDFGEPEVWSSSLCLGTTGYFRAPEILLQMKGMKDETFLKKTDVDSYGMACYEILTGNLPFSDTSADLGELLCDESDSETEEFDISSEDEGWSRESAASRESPAEVTSDSHVPQTEPSQNAGRKRSAASAFGGDDLIAKIGSLVNKQIEVAIQPLICAFRSRDEDEQRHREKMLAIEKEKWALIRQDEVGSGTDDVAKDLPYYLQIDPANLKPIRKLGKEVFVASWVGCKFAVKWLKSDHVSKLRDEVGIMMTLQHPHVVRLVGFSGMARANRCAIVMELMESSLREFMDEKMKATPKPFWEAEAVQIITQLALGMNFLHSRGVAHGNLKCANVLVRNVKEFDGNYVVVKLVDFGLSHLVESKSWIESEPSLVGLGHWRAPEVLGSMESRKPVPYDPKRADVYSFGILCFEIITGKVPNHDVTPSVVKELVKVGVTPKLDSINVGNALKDLLKDCWCLAPQNRLTFATICKRLAAMSYEHPHRCTALGESDTCYNAESILHG